MLRLLDWLPDDSDAWPRVCDALRDLQAVAEQIWTSVFREAGCDYDIAASSRRISCRVQLIRPLGLRM